MFGKVIVDCELAAMSEVCSILPEDRESDSSAEVSIGRYFVHEGKVI